MKKVLLVLTVLLCVSMVKPLETTPFNEGFEDGWCEGYKDVKGQLTICPIAPIAPLPPIDANTYKGGYNIGFKAGRKKAQE